MKKDHVLSIIFILVTGLFIFVLTRPFFLNFSNTYKLIAGFIKFFFLASLGDVLGKRLKTKTWSIPDGFIYKAIVWGVIGILITLVFGLYDGGITTLENTNLLPVSNVSLLHAFFVSLFMNLTFGPMMMAFHRVSDTFIELRVNKEKVSLKDTVEKIDWAGFIKFVVFKTIPLFWIPAHTITFILPPTYRVMFAAVLGIVLGLLLGLFNGRKATAWQKKKSKK